MVRRIPLSSTGSTRSKQAWPTTLKETPRNALVGALVDALRGIKSAARPDGPSLVTTGVGGRAIDAILPDSAIDELDNWSYGNAPMRVPEMTNIPQFKKGRASGTADAVSILPVGTAAKSAGLMIPILLRRNAKPGAEADLLKRVLLAEELKAKGATRNDIWHDAQVTEVLRASNEGRAPYKGKWAHEVSPEGPLFSPYVSMSDNDKIDRLLKPDLEQEFTKLMGAKPGTQASQNLANIWDNTAPLVQSGKLSDIVDFKNAFEQYPELGEVVLNAFPESTRGLSVLGALKGGKDQIDLYAGALTQNPKGIYSPSAVLLHELQHGVQRKFDSPNGGSVAVMQLSQPGEANLLELVRGLGTIRQQGSKTDAAAANVALNQLSPQFLRSPGERYMNLLGEAEARNASRRNLMSESLRASQHPLESYDVDIDSMIDPNVWSTARPIAEQSSFGKLDWVE